MGLGDVALSQGRLARCCALYADGIRHYLAAGERAPLAPAIERVAALCVARGDYTEAVRLFGCASRHFVISPGCLQHRPPAWQTAEIAAARPALGMPVFQQLWDAGHHLGLEHAAQMALDACQLRAASAQSSIAPPLTRRELDVLRLLAEGSSNRDVAARLTISLRTVETHVERILRKLNVANRRQATVWAYAHGVTPPPEESETVK
jgi:non-specific serine/threonine protein kinase